MLLTDDLKHVLWIILGALLLRYLGVLLIRRVFEKPFVVHREIDEVERRRRATVAKISESALGVLLTIVTILTVLPYFGVNITPLLTSAGIVGVALGLGGQFYIRDLIAGLFIFTENQYRVGDVVKLDDVSGVVEHINLRVTVLRDLEGVRHHIPNGASRHTSNLTFGFSRCNFDINVTYGTDLNRVITLIDTTGEKLAADPVWMEAIKEAPHFLRVDDFDGTGLVIKIFGTTTAAQQWEVMGEMRRRLHAAFAKANIKFGPQVAAAAPEPKKA